MIEPEITEHEFNLYIFPYLSVPKRGPKSKIGYYKLFKYIVTVIYHNIRWDKLPIDNNSKGHPEIHYTGVFKVFQRWKDDGSLKAAFYATHEYLPEEKQLDVHLLKKFL